MSVIDTVCTRLDTRKAWTAAELAEELGMEKSSVGSALRSLWRGQVAEREKVQHPTRKTKVFAYRGKQISIAIHPG
jgi:predicted transcriptional regulator